MKSANEIVRKNKVIEAEKLNEEFKGISKPMLLKFVKDLEQKLQDLIDCDGCKRRRQKIKAKLAKLKAFLNLGD
jgi:hypothetical protein